MAEGRGATGTKNLGIYPVDPSREFQPVGLRNGRVRDQAEIAAATGIDQVSEAGGDLLVAVTKQQQCWGIKQPQGVRGERFWRDLDVFVISGKVPLRFVIRVVKKLIESSLIVGFGHRLPYKWAISPRIRVSAIDHITRAMTTSRTAQALVRAKNGASRRAP